MVFSSYQTAIKDLDCGVQEYETVQFNTLQPSTWLYGLTACNKTTYKFTKEKSVYPI
jgi:hypothetical protein